MAIRTEVQPLAEYVLGFVDKPSSNKLRHCLWSCSSGFLPSFVPSRKTCSSKQATGPFRVFTFSRFSVELFSGQKNSLLCPS